MLGKITIDEVFTRMNPEVENFRIFVSIVHYHMLDDKHTKLDQTTEKGYFVDYNEMSKAYMIYMPGNRRIIMRRDMKFREEKAFRRSRRLPTYDHSGPTESPRVEK